MNFSSWSVKLVIKKYSFSIKTRNKYYNRSDAELYRKTSDLYAEYLESNTHTHTHMHAR